jgi:hypothetical protein
MVNQQLNLLQLETPTMPVFDASRCYSKPINYQTASRIVETYHYAHRVPSIVLAIGMYVDDVLAGVITYGIPPNRNVLGCCGEEYIPNALELNRLFVFDWAGRNSESWLVGQSFRWLRETDYFILVSYADSGYNHTGYIYQATNWFYTGLSAGDTEWIISGKVYHRKNVYNEFGTSSKRELEGQGHKVIIRKQGDKHRYVYFLGSKTQRKNLRELLKWDVLPYPKGDV